MARYRKVLICIHDAALDRHMLPYAGTVSRAREWKEVHFLHVAGDEPRPEPLLAGKREAITPDTLQGLAVEHFTGHGEEEVFYEVIEGSPLVEILRYAHDKDMDAIVLGRKAHPARGAILARRITRKATCSVLLLPVRAHAQADVVVVPVRDSECSANALAMACEVAKVIGARVICLNVYQVGPGYTRAGSTLEEAQIALDAAARAECQRLLKRVDTHGVTVDLECVPDLYDRAVPLILEAVTRASAGLIVIGARGRTGAAGVLLGEVTEQLIKESPIPLLAVKKKGECLGVLQALLTIARGE